MATTLKSLTSAKCMLLKSMCSDWKDEDDIGLISLTVPCTETENAMGVASMCKHLNKPGQSESLCKPIMAVL